MSVRDIARALDIKGASVYAHVASREDVLWSIVERAATRFEDAVEAAQVRDRHDAVAGLDG
jgi:TetR/AcrR family transcriptional regulator, cholesterol catabolism regulator